MSRAALHKLRLPVMAAPMFLVSGPDMVIAAARSGIAGAFPTPNCRTADELDRWMEQIAQETADAPGTWAANLVTHSSNARLADDLALVAKHKPPIVITALGIEGKTRSVARRPQLVQHISSELPVCLGDVQKHVHARQSLWP